MAWPEYLVLVRHAESEGNIRSVEQRARLDISTHELDITEHGEKQAQITGKFLQDKFGDFEINYVSYYKRSKRTMSIMYPDANVYEDPRLAEGQRGIWHTMTEDQIKAHLPWEIERKNREGLYHYRPPGGENWPDIELRIHSFLGTLNRDYDGQKVLIVVHGHWLILLQRLIHHFSIEEAMRRYRHAGFENTSVTIYKGMSQQGKSRLILQEENIVPWQGLI